MSPTTKYVVKCVLFGVGAATASLQQALPGLSSDEILNAVFGGVGVALVYAGIGYATPLEAPGKK